MGNRLGNRVLLFGLVLAMDLAVVRKWASKVTACRLIMILTAVFSVHTSIRHRPKKLASLLVGGVSEQCVSQSETAYILSDR